jgi:hypothetical protein
LAVGGEVEGEGAFSLEERELDVVCEQEELGWIGRHDG